MSVSPEHSAADPGAGDGQRIRLIVIYGGQSAEHDVSCVTAAHVMRAVDPSKYDIVPVGIDRDGTWALTAAQPAALDAVVTPLDPCGARVSPTELVGAPGHSAGTGQVTVVMPLLHGPMGEDGTVQGLLELADVAYVGSGVLGSSVSMDKAMAKEVLAARGIAQARYVALRESQIRPETAAEVAETLGLPVFVKPANMGSSVGVSKAKTVAQIAAAIDEALRYDEWVVVEEAITGREIEVGVLGNASPRASVAGEIVPGAEFYNYADKYVDGASQTLVPARLSEAESDEVRTLAIEVYGALRCDGLARVDFFYEEGGRGFLINEVNTMPGFTPISMYPKLWIASGMTYSALIDELVALALERHQRRRRNTAHD